MLCYRGFHRVDVRHNLRLFQYERAVDIADFPAVGFQDFDCASQEDFRIDVFELSLGIGKMVSDVALVGSTQKRITNGVQQHISIGMSKGSFGVI